MTSLERLHHRVRLLEMERKGKFHIVFYNVDTETQEEALQKYKQENKVNPHDNFIVIKILPEDLKQVRKISTKEGLETV